VTDDHPGVYIRLDGARSSLFTAARFFDRVTWLDEVGPVPELPMGRFRPTVDDLEGEWEGVPVCRFENGHIIALTPDRKAALAALAAYCTDMDYGVEAMSLGDVQSQWAVFTWQPEDAECPWLMDDANEGDDQAIQLHYLPA
jgi:hypothetical protein